MRFVALIIAGLTIGGSVATADDDIVRVLADTQPNTIPTMIPGAEPAGELPTLLTVPGEPAIRSSNRKNCRTCANDYNPNLAYLPDQNPDCRTGKCAKGDCITPESWWATADLFVGINSDIRDVKHQLIYGYKLGLGAWLDSANKLGLEGGFFNVHDPYRDIFLGQRGPTLIDSPLTLSTADINLRAELFTHGRWRVDGLAGYRYLSLNEQLLETTTMASNFWRATNSVNLGQIGAVGVYRFGPYSGELMLKLGYGRNAEAMTLNGVRTTTTDAAFVPELGIRLGYGMGQGVRTVIGYNLIYLNGAMRPDQRDPPNFLLQGLTAGLEVRY